MRTPVVVALVLSAACREEAVCDDATCAAVCEDHEARMQALVPEGGTLLSAFEHETLGPLLAEVRTGVLPVEGEPSGICEGQERCERFLGTEALDAPNRPYVLRAVFKVPRAGAWTAHLTGTCVSRTAPREPVRTEIDRTVPLVPSGEDGIVRIDPLFVFPVPPRGELGCSGAIDVEGEGSRDVQWHLLIPPPPR